MTRRLPVLLLDVDGVIAILGPGDHEPTTDIQVGEWPITLSLDAPRRLLRLFHNFQMVWATSWDQQACDELAVVVGLPDGLPHLTFDPSSFKGLGSYKLEAVKCFVRDRPAAWIDDELSEDALAYFQGRIDQPSLIIQPDPRYGLTDEHVEKLLKFADTVRRQTT